MTTDTRERAAEAARLLDSPLLQEVLAEIEKDARWAFLASGGDPAKMAAAYQQARAAETLRARLKAHVDAQRRADQREQ